MNELWQMLKEPPKSAGQVVEWVATLGLEPSEDRWKQARAAPPDTSLGAILLHLGADEGDLRDAAHDAAGWEELPQEEAEAGKTGLD